MEDGTLHARIIGLVSLCLSLCLSRASSVRAEDAAPALACAVEAAPLHAKGLDGVCLKLSNELGRTVRPVEDARRVKRGQGVQIIATDVTWYVVMLEAGRVRAFTRISATEARGRELSFVARAVRALSGAKPVAPQACLRIDPSHTDAKTDIVYPWAELAPCTRTVLDVRDPWWLPVEHVD